MRWIYAPLYQGGKAGCHPVLFSLTPRDAWKTVKIGTWTRLFGLWAKQVAEAENVPFVDLNDIISTHKFEQYGPERNVTISISTISIAVGSVRWWTPVRQPRVSPWAVIRDWHRCRRWWKPLTLPTVGVKRERQTGGVCHGWRYGEERRPWRKQYGVGGSSLHRIRPEKDYAPTVLKAGQYTYLS